MSAVEQGQFMQAAANMARQFAPLSATLAAVLAVCACSSNSSNEAGPAAPSASASPAADEACAPENTTTNTIHDVASHRPIGDGLRNADGTLANAATVKKRQIESVGDDAYTLVNAGQALQKPFSDILGTAKITLERVAAPIKNKPTDLCLTAFGQRLRTEVQFIYKVSTPTASEAKPTDRNSGTDSKGNLVAAATAGISGDRSSVVYTTPDGRSFEQMVRCGNFVNPGPNTPVGPTDQSPKPRPTDVPTKSPTSRPTVAPTEAPTPRPTVPPKTDDGRLPQVPGAAPAEQDPDTPDKAGNGPAGQSPAPNGTVPGEILPTQAPYSPKPQPSPTRTQEPITPVETGAPQASTQPVIVVTAVPQATATTPPQPN